MDPLILSTEKKPLSKWRTTSNPLKYINLHKSVTSVFKTLSHQYLYVFGGDGGNRTHVQRYRHSGFYTLSQYIIIRLLYSLPTGFRAASLIHFNYHPQTVNDSIARFI